MIPTVILIVEDESIVAMDLQYRLEGLGYRVCGIASNSADAVKKAASFTPDLILMDIVLKGDRDGIETAALIYQRLSIPVIFLTAYGDDKTLQRAKLTQPYGYILKPFETRDLYTCIEMALYKSGMENELRKSESKFRLLINTIPNMVFKGYEDWSIDFFDNKIEALTGYCADDFTQRRVRWSDCIVPEDIAAAKEAFAGALKTTKSYLREYRIRNKDGGIFWISEAASIVLDKDNKVEYISGAFLDVTRRKDEEDDLKIVNECFLNFKVDSSENIQRVVETVSAVLSAPYVVYNRLDNSVLAKAAAVGPFEHPAINPDKERCIFYYPIKEGAERIRVLRDVEKSGYAVTDPVITAYKVKTYLGSAVIADNKVTGSLSVLYQKDRVFSDTELRILSIVTRAIGIEEERRHQQEQIIQASKMSGIGMLAGGVAHEFNNLIAIIRAKTEMALLEPGEKNIQDAFKSAMVATDRAQRITQGLLNFSKRVRPNFEHVDIAEVINEMLQLVEREIEKQGIRLIRDFEPVPAVYGDIGQIQQVVLNIVINAKEAMPKGGVMTIGVKSSDTDIFIRVSDTGEGIKQECLDRIFEPFFTTKDKSGGSLKIGTGLGLSVSLGIIRSYGGNITIETGSGGTTFTVSLPRGK